MRAASGGISCGCLGGVGDGSRARVCKGDASGVYICIDSDRSLNARPV